MTLISPFAGRITDFFKARDKVDAFPAPKDPGVVSVKNIYNYYKKHHYKTVVMGASFRSAEQVLELAGCDLLTVAPAILQQIQSSNVEVVRKLDHEHPESNVEKEVLDEATFRWRMNEDEMAEFKTAEGIRKFAQDLVKLEEELRKRL